MVEIRNMKPVSSCSYIWKRTVLVILVFSMAALFCLDAKEYSVCRSIFPDEIMDVPFSIGECERSQQKEYIDIPFASNLSFTLFDCCHDNTPLSLAPSPSVKLSEVIYLKFHRFIS